MLSAVKHVAKSLPAGVFINLRRGVCNGWCTSARFAKKVRDCRWCGMMGGDEHVHYLLCIKWRVAVAANWPRLALPKTRPEAISWMCCLDAPNDDEARRRALLADLAHKAFAERGNFTHTPSLDNFLDARQRHWWRSAGSKVYADFDRFEGRRARL